MSIAAPPPVVEWRCDARGDACLLLRVYAAPGGPVVMQPAQRLSPDEAGRQGRQRIERRSRPAATPLDRLERLGVFGPLACSHRVLLHARAIDVRQDYEQALHERRLIRRFLGAPATP